MDVARLAALLLARIDSIAEAMVDRIHAEVVEYEKVVTREELLRSCESELRSVLGVLTGDNQLDRTVGLTIGRRRAEANVPLPTVLAGYRVGVRFLWEAFVAEAAGASDALVRTASAIWIIQDEITETMISGYRDATTERLLAREHERSALVAALLAGMTIDTADLWAAADVLRIPRRGPFVVVAAEVPEIGRQALPRAEDLLRRVGIHSAWQLRPDVHIGVVHLGPLDKVVEILGREAVRRVGVSPTYDDLYDTGDHLRLAQIAMTSGPAGSAAVALFDANPIAVTAAAAPDVTGRFAHALFAAVPESERTVLLLTLETWFARGGSTEDTAEALFCHPNTVRMRLRRITEHTGRSLSHPRDVAELCLALYALRQED
jgi:hypothetical protein